MRTKLPLLIVLLSSFSFTSCASTAGKRTAPDASTAGKRTAPELIEHKFNGWSATGDARFDAAGEVLAAINTAVQSNFKSLHAELDSGPTFAKFNNAIAAELEGIANPTAEDKAAANDAVAETMTAADYAVIRSHRENTKSPVAEIVAAMLKGAAHSAILAAAMKDLDYSETLKFAGLPGSAENLGSDFKVAGEMEQCAKLYALKLREWDEAYVRFNKN